jgi:alkanesulfonate monooxygenase SsuD/methylene tetrahydromethanopterin reductase-like flavin-dependent oxidoreductase (luciferase family)
VLFGYLAGVTRRIELATGGLVLPQRQTALLGATHLTVSTMGAGHATVSDHLAGLRGPGRPDRLTA